MHQKDLNYNLICQNTSASEGLRPPDPLPCFKFQQKIFSWMWAIEHGLELTMHVIIYFKCLLQICTKMNDLKFDFSNIFWGGAHRAPSPDPFPRFFSGFALISQALRAFDSGFALNSRALRALDSGTPSTFDWRTWFGPPPPKINSWIRPCDLLVGLSWVYIGRHLRVSTQRIRVLVQIRFWFSSASSYRVLLCDV